MPGGRTPAAMSAGPAVLRGGAAARQQHDEGPPVPGRAERGGRTRPGSPPRYSAGPRQTGTGGVVPLLATERKHRPAFPGKPGKARGTPRARRAGLWPRRAVGDSADPVPRPLLPGRCRGRRLVPRRSRTPIGSSACSTGEGRASGAAGCFRGSSGPPKERNSRRATARGPHDGEAPQARPRNDAQKRPAEAGETNNETGGHHRPADATYARGGLRSAARGRGHHSGASRLFGVGRRSSAGERVSMSSGSSCKAWR